MSLEIRVEPFDSEEARRLVSRLDSELGALYPPEQRFGPNLKPEQLDGGRGAFLIARSDGVAVGCGAIRLLDAGTAEVKRMYADSDRRGEGIGRAVLGELERLAAGMGVRRLVLETGVHQHAAIGLYRSAGYEPVDCWGEYATAPTSVCFEKRL